MATTLLQESARANDSAFRAAVEAAFYRVISDVIGEAVGATVQEQSGPVQLTAAMIAKRHAWAVSAQTNPGLWIPILSKLLVGEQQIRNIDMPSIPDDAAITDCMSRMVSNVSGVLASEKV